MTNEEKYKNICKEMLDFIEENIPTDVFYLDQASKIAPEGWNTLLPLLRARVDNGIAFSKGWNANAYRIKIIYDKIKKEKTDGLRSNM